MTACKSSEQLKKYAKEISFISKYERDQAPAGVLNTACAMALGYEIKSFDENSVVIVDGESRHFDIFNNPSDALELLKLGEFVIGSNASSHSSALQLPENKDVREKVLYFSSHAGFSSTNSGAPSLEGALAKSAFALVKHEIKFPHEGRDLANEKQEVEELRIKLKNRKP